MKKNNKPTLLFDEEKWQSEIEEVNRNIARFEDTLVRTQTLLELDIKRREQLESVRRFIVEPKQSKGRVVKTTSSTESIYGKTVAVPPPMDESFKPTVPNLIKAVLNKKTRLTAYEIQLLVEERFSETCPREIPDEHMIQLNLMSWLHDSNICPEGVSVGMCQSKDRKGLVGAKLDKGGYGVPSKTNPYIKFILEYCRDNGHVDQGAGVTRERLFKTVGKEFPEIMDVPKTISKLLDDIADGKIVVRVLNQAKEGRYMKVWANPLREKSK